MKRQVSVKWHQSSQISYEAKQRSFKRCAGHLQGRTRGDGQFFLACALGAGIRRRARNHDPHRPGAAVLAAGAGPGSGAGHARRSGGPTPGQPACDGFGSGADPGSIRPHDRALRPGAQGRKSPDLRAWWCGSPDPHRFGAAVDIGPLPSHHIESAATAATHTCSTGRPPPPCWAARCRR